MYIRYFLFLSLAPTESFADLLLRMLWGVLLAEQRAWFRIVSFLHAVGTSLFFLLLSSTTLIVMDRPDFCFFFFFFFTPLHHPIQHPQVGRWAVETITCGGPLGIYSAIHSRREEVNTYLYPLRPDNSNNNNHNRYAELLEIGLVLLQRPGTPTENQFARSSPSQGNHPDNHYYLVLVGLASCHQVVVVVNSLKAVTSLYAIPQPIQPVHEMAKTEKIE